MAFQRWRVQGVCSTRQGLEGESNQLRAIEEEHSLAFESTALEKAQGAPEPLQTSGHGTIADKTENSFYVQVANTKNLQLKFLSSDCSVLARLGLPATQEWLVFIHAEVRHWIRKSPMRVVSRLKAQASESKSDREERMVERGS